MNFLQTSQLWKQSGRWKNFEGEEFFHFKNRDDKDFCLAVTHEEAADERIDQVIEEMRSEDSIKTQQAEEFTETYEVSLNL